MDHRKAPLILVVILTSFCLASLAVSGESLETYPAELQAVPERAVFYGRIQAVNQATVSAETQGRVETVTVDIGDTVMAGAVLLTMTSEEQHAGLTQAEANLADARSNLATDKLEFQRISDLQEKGYVSKADMDRATNRLNASKARVQSTEAALRTAREQLSYTEVKAPYSGIVSDRHIEVGEAVRPGTMLISGYDPSAFRVEVDIPQSTAVKVRQFNTAQIATLANGGKVAQRIIEPETLILYPTVDPATSTVRVRLELPKNTLDLYPGQFVEVAFTTGEYDRLLIPGGSVVYRSEVSAVYILRDETVHLRQVRLGTRYGEQVEVLAGLVPAERIARDPVAAAEQMARQKAAAAE